MDSFDSDPLSMPDFSTWGQDEGFGIECMDIGDAGYNPLGKCDNCGRDDWDVDERGGDLVCVGCGLCVPGVAVHQLSRTDKQQAYESGAMVCEENVRDAAFGFCPASPVRRGRSRGAYKRATYLRQRLAQWCMSDPPIDRDDWRSIVQVWQDFCLLAYGTVPVVPSPFQLRTGRGRAVKGAIVPTKEQIRSVLDTCDTLDTDRYDEEGEESPKRCFLRRYRKRWLSIRWRLSGYKTLSQDMAPDFMELLTDDFPRVEQAFNAVVRERFHRKAINYNEAIRHLMELYSLEDLDEDFPRLRTRRARKRSFFHWWHICKYLEWPFLCNESKILRSVMKSKD
jgi:hypothetical protein